MPNSALRTDLAPTDWIPVPTMGCLAKVLEGGYILFRMTRGDGTYEPEDEAGECDDLGPEENEPFLAALRQAIEDHKNTPRPLLPPPDPLSPARRVMVPMRTAAPKDSDLAAVLAQETARFLRARSSTLAAEALRVEIVPTGFAVETHGCPLGTLIDALADALPALEAAAQKRVPQPGIPLCKGELTALVGPVAPKVGA